MSEFCRQCGAGIGKHRREGEGTCPACDPLMGKNEAQRRMYELAEEKYRLQSEINRLDSLLETVTEERRKIFYEFPTIDIYREQY